MRNMFTIISNLGGRYVWFFMRVAFEPGRLSYPTKNKSLQGFWGVAFSDGPSLQPDPVGVISIPLKRFENICIAADCMNHPALSISTSRPNPSSSVPISREVIHVVDYIPYFMSFRIR